MPSFDIVSEVNSMEIENAVNIAKKELANRFDFKGSKAEIVLEKNEIKLSAEDQFKITALVEIVIGKLAKRNISMKNVEQGDPDVSPLGHARQRRAPRSWRLAHPTLLARPRPTSRTTRVAGRPSSMLAAAHGVAASTTWKRSSSASWAVKAVRPSRR